MSIGTQRIFGFSHSQKMYLINYNFSKTTITRCKVYHLCIKETFSILALSFIESWHKIHQDLYIFGKFKEFYPMFVVEACSILIALIYILKIFFLFIYFLELYHIVMLYIKSEKQVISILIAKYFIQTLKNQKLAMAAKIINISIKTKNKQQINKPSKNQVNLYVKSLF